MMTESQPIRDLVVGVLTELGVPSPSAVIQTLLVRDGCFVGHSFRFDGGYAIWCVGSPAIEFYDQYDNLLKMVNVEALMEGEAA